MKITTSKHRADWLLGLLLLAFGCNASAAVTGSFTATYGVSYGFIGLGTLTFDQHPGEQPNCYVYAGQGQPTAIVSMLVGNLSDASRYCVTDSGAIQPQHFRHHEEGDPEDSYTLTFDWANGSVRYQNRDGKTRVMALPQSATDPLSLQVAARMWVASELQPGQSPKQTLKRDFTLVDEDEIKTYTLALKPGDTIKVPAGQFDTVIVERVDNKNETLRFWLATYADWIPVRVQHEKNGRTITMNLKSLQREKQDSP